MQEIWYTRSSSSSAVDIATKVASVANSTHLVFKIARWPIAEYILGLHFTVFFTKIIGDMMPSWIQNRRQKFIHSLPFVVPSFWNFLMWATKKELNYGPDDPLTPKHSLVEDLRTSAWLVPEHFY